MSVRLIASFSAAAGFLFFSVASLGHQGSNTVYDLNQTITIEGTITDFQFVNPHTLIFLDVTGEDGAVVSWLGGLSGPNHLAREEGWTRDTFKPGDQVSIIGAPARGGTPSVWIEQVFLNGTPLLAQQYTG